MCYCGICKDIYICFSRIYINLTVQFGGILISSPMREGPPGQLEQVGPSPRQPNLARPSQPARCQISIPVYFLVSTGCFFTAIKRIFSQKALYNIL